MGAKLHGLRGPLNDNRRPGDERLDERPIRADEFRHAPVIEREPGRAWFCVVTVPQGEYRCAARLGERGVACYVPTDTHWTMRRKGRERFREQVQVPIFRGYLFACLTPPGTVDYGGGPEVACGPEWRPLMERDPFGRNPHGVLGVIGYYGMPLPIPLRRVETRFGELCRVGVADFADDEREGWFDDRRRPALIAGRDAKPPPVVAKGEAVRVTSGPFASFQGLAENDNDERGSVRLTVSIFGRETPMTLSLDDLENLTRPQSKSVPSLRRA